MIALPYAAVRAVSVSCKQSELPLRLSRRTVGAHKAPPYCALIFCALLPVLGGLARAQDSEESAPASLLFVNAVHHPGFCFLVLDEHDANPAGYPGGVATGWVSFPAGTLQAQVEHQPLGVVDLELELKPREHLALIAHNLTVSQEDRGRPPRPTIGVLRLPCVYENPQEGGKKKSRNRSLTLVNVSSQERIELDLDGKTEAAERLQPRRVQVEAPTGFIPVTLRQPSASAADDPTAETAAPEPLLTLNTEDEAMRYLVFFDDEDGGVRALSFELRPNGGGFIDR